MSIASTLFLFLFLPITVGLYFLIPCRKGLLLRNLFLLLVSLFFYAWGEPVFIFLLLLLILLTWLFGKMAEGRRNTRRGKTAVLLTVLVNAAVLFGFKRFTPELRALGLLSGEALSSAVTILPLGLSFFCFHAVSYVVDIYRGQCRTPKSILYTALYLSVFFKVLQGPIISYRAFEPQLENRTVSWEDLAQGLRRFSVGFAKKMIIAENLGDMLQTIFTSDLSLLPAADAWIGCAVYMIFLYFDFSGYSDMAIGLARIFGFRLPENFNYPYLSGSVSEYWRRWHITLCAWFRDYLYYPILLGPSVRFRKYLLRRHVNGKTAKTLQYIFVPSCVWLVTALWHGTNLNCLLWGLVNGAAILIEPYIRPLKNKAANTALRRFLLLLLLLLITPLVCTGSMSAAALCYRAMFAGTGVYAVSAAVRYFLRADAVFLLIGAVCCFPVLPILRRRLYPKHQKMQLVWEIGEAVLLMGVVLVSLVYLVGTGTVVFMYQQ